MGTHETVAVVLICGVCVSIWCWFAFRAPDAEPKSRSRSEELQIDSDAMHLLDRLGEDFSDRIYKAATILAEQRGELRIVTVDSIWAAVKKIGDDSDREPSERP
jgi:hypothetical protein